MRALLLSVLALGCRGAGDGDVVVTVSGESFVERGIPATEFADGWSISFERFAVEVEGARFGALPASPARSVDVVAGAVVLARFPGVPAARYDDLRFTLRALDLAGAARRGAVVKRFAWTFERPTEYSACRLADEGVVVRDDELTSVEITLHADHLFRDELGHEAPLRFDALAAADADGDGEITLAELANVRLAAIPAELGTYRTAGADVDSLAQFLAAQTRTLGHFNGEGECVARTASPDPAPAAR